MFLFLFIILYHVQQHKGIKINISNLSLPHVIYEVSVLTMAVKTKTIMAYNIGHLHLFILRNTVAQENFVKVFCRLFFHIIQCFISFLCVRQEVVNPPPPFPMTR